MGKKIVRRLYNWVLHWANTPYGAPALFLLAFVESSFFPIPPDVLLIALAVSIPLKSFKFATICTAGSVIGGLFGYLIGYKVWYTIDGNFTPFAMMFFNYIPGFTDAVFNKVIIMYNENAFISVFTAAFTPIPYKVFTISAGVSKVDLTTFTVASIIGRGLRFFLLALIIYKFGSSITTWIDKYFNKLAILFTILIIGGFMLVQFVL
jgi:membrane protein YqaA with SNARE-associated domain